MHSLLFIANLQNNKFGYCAILLSKFIKLQTNICANKLNTLLRDLNRGAINTNTKLEAFILLHPLLRHNAWQHCK